MENVSRGENSPDHTVLITGQETTEVVESDAEKYAVKETATLQEKAAVANAIQKLP